MVVPHQSTGSLYRNYNALLDEATKIENLEALVIVHQDAEIVDPDFSEAARGDRATPRSGWSVAPEPWGCGASPGGRGL